MITQKSLEADFLFFKNQAKAKIQKVDYEGAIDAIKTAVTIAQNYCLLYADQEIEDLLLKTAKALAKCQTIKDFKTVPGRIVFYDGFSRDNVMLTTQYVNALNAMNCDFMYLTLNPKESIEKQRFYQDLKRNPRATIVAANGYASIEEAFGQITHAIEMFRPEKTLIHTRSEDIVGLLPWYIFTSTDRYYVEVTDHSYWPGVDALDKCICFRNYGYSNAVHYRGIQPDRILILPFYPVTVDYPYEGIPESVQNSVKLFSGGRVTKILDEQDTFLNLIKRVLTSHPNTEFYYAGGGLIDGAGRFSHIQRFIRRNGLEERFHLLGQRKDILEVSRHMDVFINTYPFGGGLMVQIAAMCHLPIVILSKNGLCASIEEFLHDDAWQNQEVTYFSEEAVDEVLDQLIKNEKYRRRLGDKLSQEIITSDEFSVNLEKALTTGESPVSPLLHDGDYELRRRINIQMDNLVFQRYYGILLRSKLLKKEKPLRYFWAALKFVAKSDKGYLINTIKRYILK